MLRRAMMAGGTTPPRWTPSALASLVAWYSADEPGNTIVSGLMDTLYDKSGNGNHAAKYSANNANRGQIWAAAQNGLPVWGYDTMSRQAYFRSTNAHILASGNNVGGLSVFAVTAQITALGGSTGVIANLSTGTSDASARLQMARGAFSTSAVSGGGRRLDANSLVSVSNSTAYGLSYLIAGAINDYTNSDAFVWVDGSAAGSNTSFQTAGNTSATNSQAFNIGATGANLNPHPGRVGELVLCNAALGTTDRQKLEGYLAHRWGLAGSLPGGHPYKASPPTL